MAIVLTASQQHVFRTAYQHFEQAGALLNQKQYLKNTTKRLQSAGMSWIQATAQAKQILVPGLTFEQPKKSA